MNMHVLAGGFLGLFIGALISRIAGPAPSGVVVVFGLASVFFLGSAIWENGRS